MSFAAAQLVHLSRLKKGHVFFLISNRPYISLYEIPYHRIIKSYKSSWLTNLMKIFSCVSSSSEAVFLCPDRLKAIVYQLNEIDYYLCDLGLGKAAPNEIA